VHDQLSPRVALVVDDEFLIVVELESILNAAGFIVLSAVSVAEARQVMARSPIDVAVLDFRMGPEATALARELQRRNVPIVFCTASMLDEVAALFPATPVVAKPFTTDMLLTTLETVLPR
jgi:CheY-like chemotaxis protein